MSLLEFGINDAAVWLEDRQHAKRQQAGAVPQHCQQPMEHLGGGYYACTRPGCDGRLDIPTYGRTRH